MRGELMKCELCFKGMSRYPPLYTTNDRSQLLTLSTLCLGELKKLIGVAAWFSVS